MFSPFHKIIHPYKNCKRRRILVLVNTARTHGEAMSCYPKVAISWLKDESSMFVNCAKYTDHFTSQFFRLYRHWYTYTSSIIIWETVNVSLWE